MNTIKIYLAESGALAQLQMDFPLYQYQFNNKLLNIYVPTSICAGPFINEDVVEGYACQVKMDYMNSQNRQIRTGAFYCRFVKTLTQNGVEYALFERTLPYAFTLYAGQGVGAPIITTTIINVAEYDGEPSVVSTISSQEVPLEVLPSTSVADIDEPIDADVVTELEAQMTSIMQTLALKQNIALDATTINQIAAIITSGITPEQVEPSLISLFTRTQANLEKNTTQDTRLTNAEGEIENIKTSMATGIRIIGTMTVLDALPTQAQLNAYRVFRGYTDTSNGDIIWIQEQITGGTDKFYMATYDVQTELWTTTEIQFLEVASNTDKGIVQGNIGDTADTSKILFDIQNGKIVDALAYRNNAWVSVRDYLTTIDNIMNGSVAVPKATGDAVGNNIENTYLTQTAGATKDYVRKYATPKVINDLYYFDFTDNELVDSVVDNANPITANITALGDNLIGAFELTLPQDILLGNKNGMYFTGHFEPASDIEGKIKSVVYYTLASEEHATEYVLGSELTNTQTFNASTLYSVNINALFDQLSDPTTLKENDKIIVKLYFYAEDTYTTTLNFVANETYKSLAFIDKYAYVEYLVETDDYNALSNKPIQYEDLSAVVDLTDLPVNTLYMHTGASTTTYAKGMLYFRKPNESVMTPLYKEWVDSAEFSDGTAITRTGNKLVIPSVAATVINIEATPTQNSQNIVTSGGIYNALQDKADLTDIAPAYDNTTTYGVGDLVIYNGQIYKCNTTISTAEDWDSTKWDWMDIETLLNFKQDALTTFSVSEGTIDKAIGFDSSNNLVKGSAGGAVEVTKTFATGSALFTWLSTNAKNIISIKNKPTTSVGVDYTITTIASDFTQTSTTSSIPNYIRTDRFNEYHIDEVTGTAITLKSSITETLSGLYYSVDIMVKILFTGTVYVEGIARCRYFNNALTYTYPTTSISGTYIRGGTWNIVLCAPEIT